MSEKFDQSKEKTLNKEQVIAEIKMIMQQCAVMGANDSEIPTLMSLIASVDNGEIEPQEALTKAHQILASKQDYH